MKLLAYLFIATAAAAQAPAGFRTGKDALSGLQWYWPTAYKQVPLAPTEQVLKARYQRKSPPDELRREKGRNARQARSFQPQIQVFLFAKAQARTTPGLGEKPKQVKPAKARTIREAMEMGSRVRSFSEFKKKKLAGWELTPIKGKKKQFKLTRRRGPLVGHLVLQEKAGTALGVYGFTLEPHYRKLSRVLRTMAKGLRVGPRAVKGSAHDALERMYRHKKLRAVAQRIAIRKGLSKGWKAVDTKNFIIVHHTKNEKLVNKIARDVEAMRLVYQKIFPPAQPVTAVSIVRICRSQGEYRFYGGPPGTGGYWHAGNEELVFFDYLQTQKERTRKELKKQRRRLSNKDSLLVLYHEALHQYIYYAIGEVAPHDWFNEGHGDYFSGALIPQYGKKVLRIRPSPWRIDRAKKIIATGKGFVPLKRLLRAPRSEFYNRRVIGNYYALAWSFVYFLRDPKVAKAHPSWHAMLNRYFEALKSNFAAELKRLGRDANFSDKRRASAIAKKGAIETALKGLPLEEIELEWKAYVLHLKK